MRVWRRSKARAAIAWPRAQDSLYVGLTLALWLSGCALAALGTLTATFFVLSGAGLHPFLLQLHNLTVRYVAADAGRQAAFVELTGVMAAALLVGVCLMRLPVLRQRLRAGRDRRAGGVA